MKIDSVLRAAHDIIHNDKVKTSGKVPPDPRMQIERNTVNNSTAVLLNVEEATISLGESSVPTSQDADLYTAGIIAALDNFWKMLILLPLPQYLLER